jgi:hypothetical protein
VVAAIRTSAVPRRQEAKAKTIPNPEGFAFLGSLLHPFSCVPKPFCPSVGHCSCRCFGNPGVYGAIRVIHWRGNLLTMVVICCIVCGIAVLRFAEAYGTEMGYNLGPFLGMQNLHVFVMFGIQLCIFKAPNSDCCLNHPQFFGVEELRLSAWPGAVEMLKLTCSIWYGPCWDCVMIAVNWNPAIQEQPQNPTVHQCLDLFNGNGLEVNIPYFSTDLIVWSWLYVYIPRYPSHLLRAWALPLCRGHPVGA